MGHTFESLFIMESDIENDDSWAKIMKNYVNDWDKNSYFESHCLDYQTPKLHDKVFNTVAEAEEYIQSIHHPCMRPIAVRVKDCSNAWVNVYDYVSWSNAPKPEGAGWLVGANISGV